MHRMLKMLQEGCKVGDERCALAALSCRYPRHDQGEAGMPLVTLLAPSLYVAEQNGWVHRE